jgi:hypothetical protein
VLYVVRVLSKESNLLVLPWTSCYISLSTDHSGRAAWAHTFFDRLTTGSMCWNPTCMYVFSVFVLPFGVEAFRWADLLSKESYQLSMRLIFSEINCEWEPTRRRTGKSHLEPLYTDRNVSDICITIERTSDYKNMNPLSRWNTVSLTSDVSSAIFLIRFFFFGAPVLEE